MEIPMFSRPSRWGLVLLLLVWSIVLTLSCLLLGTALASAPQTRYDEHLTGWGTNTTSILRTGQAKGLRSNIFAKVGDSITVEYMNMTPLGEGRAVLSPYDFLYPSLAYFLTDVARDKNSFADNAISAYPGWASADLLNPYSASKVYDFCNGDSPLVCEYRIVRPAIALIMIGTNDAGLGVSPEQYQVNLNQIIQTSLDHGVLPILHTIPYRYGADVTPFNAIIRDRAAFYKIPLIDFFNASMSLPGWGLREDGVHLSTPPGDNTAVFRDVSYGYTLRNVLALLALDKTRQYQPGVATPVPTSGWRIGR
jgi:hypothetical protein